MARMAARTAARAGGEPPAMAALIEPRICGEGRFAVGHESTES